ncbi:hypothetical protein ID866_12522 [Astraeus odoratus]|nr:hypothetical protein ID866_12522 [Astraeus odoratus]
MPLSFFPLSPAAPEHPILQPTLLPTLHTHGIQQGRSRGTQPTQQQLMLIFTGSLSCVQLEGTTCLCLNTLQLTVHSFIIDNSRPPSHYRRRKDWNFKRIASTS